MATIAGTSDPQRAAIVKCASILFSALDTFYGPEDYVRYP